MPDEVKEFIRQVSIMRGEVSGVTAALLALKEAIAVRAQVDNQHRDRMEADLARALAGIDRIDKFFLTIALTLLGIAFTLILTLVGVVYGLAMK